MEAPGRTKATVSISGNETIELVAVPQYEGFTVKDGPNEGHVVRPFGGNVYMSILGPRGGQRYIVDLSPAQCYALATHLMAARADAQEKMVWTEENGYVRA